MITSLLRIAIDIFFLIIPNSNVEFCVEPFKQHWMYTYIKNRFSIGYIAFGSIVNHFLPILVFFYIYNYNLKEHKDSK